MTDEERSIDVEGRQARLAALLAASPNDNGGSIYDAPKPTRKRRSDAGKPKAKKAEAVPGVLTAEQVKMAQQLSADTLAAQLEWFRSAGVEQRAASKFESAGKALRDYLDSLKGTA